jgi:hypothetical protein
MEERKRFLECGDSTPVASVSCRGKDMYDLTSPRDPENGQVRSIREQLQARLPAGTPVETTVPVTNGAGGPKITDIDILVNNRVVVLVKGGRSTGSGQLAQAENFLPIDRQGAPNPYIHETNPNDLPIVVYVTHLGPHARQGLEAAGVQTFGGGRNASERHAQFLLFLDHVVSLAAPPPAATPPGSSPPVGAP